jgi:Fe2+ or Zn2+ uptake regulation protein
MDASRIISALDSELRRETLKILAEHPDNVIGVMQRLKGKGYDLKYRETVYRALEKLVAAGLIEKYYEQKSGLCYKLVSRRLTIEIKRESINIEN